MEIYIVRQTHKDKDYEDLEYFSDRTEAERWMNAYILEKSSSGDRIFHNTRKKLKEEITVVFVTVRAKAEETNLSVDFDLRCPCKGKVGRGRWFCHMVDCDLCGEHSSSATCINMMCYVCTMCAINQS